MRLALILLFIPFVARADLAQVHVQTRIRELAEAIRDFDAERACGDFDLVVTLSSAVDRNTLSFAAEDDSGAMVFESQLPPSDSRELTAGTRVRMRGSIQIGRKSRRAYAGCRQIEFLAAGKPPAPRTATGEGLLNGEFDCRLVRLDGFIRDVIADEIDPNYSFFVLNCNGTLINATVSLRNADSRRLPALIGQEVTVRGFCSPFDLGGRRQIGRIVTVVGTDGVRIRESAPKDPYSADDISRIIGLQPFQVARLPRHRATGRVRAVWNGKSLLLETPAESFIRVDLLDTPPPHVGDAVDAVGFPECDLYHINLVKALWRMSKTTDIPASAAHVQTGVRSLITGTADRRIFNPFAHGSPIRIRGIVRSVPASDADSLRLFVESERQLIAVDVSSVPEALSRVRIGCTVELTGICVMDTDSTADRSLFPKIRGFFLVLNRDADLAVLSLPSWWTTQRLLTVIGVLLALLSGFFIWNIALRRLATRKGRELFKEQLGHVKADLRTEERTRLAVELHDTLAQNLTGVSMEIEAANDLRGDAPKPMLDHLGIAAKALKSCRDELRNCLWDLRSQALEEPDMTKAVLKTLQPVVNDSRLAVRFNVPRARLSDNTAHALLRVVRELVINAIRHGNAKSVKVAGTIDNGKLLCSVTDDGCGFDPETAPGILQGHFGLQGIQERIEELGGEFTIRSSCGKGTKATINIPIPHES